MFYTIETLIWVFIKNTLNIIYEINYLKAGKKLGFKFQNISFILKKELNYYLRQRNNIMSSCNKIFAGSVYI